MAMVTNSVNSIEFLVNERIRVVEFNRMGSRCVAVVRSHSAGVAACDGRNVRRIVVVDRWSMTE